MSKRNNRPDPAALDGDDAPSGQDLIEQGYGLNVMSQLTAVARQSGATPRALADGTIEVSGVHFTPTGMKFETVPTADSWRVVGGFFKQTRSALKWWVGDWINAANEEWGKIYELAAEITTFKVVYLRNVAWIAGKIDVSLRSDKLMFAHYAILAELIENPYDIAKWVRLAVEGKWSSRKLRVAIRGENQPQEQTSHDLLNKVHKRRFSRVWRKLSKGQPPTLEDVHQLEVWVRTLREEIEAQRE